MKKKWFFLYFSLSLLLPMLCGCESNKPSATFTPTQTPTLFFSPSLTPTLTFTPFPTFTPVATLAPADANAYLRELLTDTRNCSLPCWLGITPGLSTSQEAHDLLAKLGSIADWFGVSLDYPTEIGNLSTASFEIQYPSDNTKIVIHPAFFTTSNGNVVSISGFDAYAYRLSDGVYLHDYPPYNELMKTYTFSNILSTYGLPDQMYILALESTPLYYFQIHVWYPEKGTFLTYEMIDASSGNGSGYYRLCPTNAMISGDMTQSGLTDFRGFLLNLYEDRYKNFFPPSDFAKTTEEAFGLTDNEFYQIFRYPTTRCLDTPKAMWPIQPGP